MMKKNENLTISKTTLWQGVSGVLGLLLVLSIFTGGFGIRNLPTGNTVQQPTGQQAPAPQAAPSPQPTPSPNPEIDMKLLSDDDPFKGDENAPVVMIEFSDFQCPFCGRFYSQTLDQIMTQYVDTGKVKFVYRDFPLDNLHPQARPAAEAAECANEQGKFWEFHNKIFDNQQSLSAENYKAWAAELGLDTKQFNDCVDSRKYQAEVQKDFSDGSSVGVRGTPGFIINGQLVSGAQPFSNFQQVIEAALNS